MIALAAAARHAAAIAPAELRPALAEHAREETEHINLWGDFRQALAGDAAAEPLDPTLRCAAAWAGSPTRGLPETLGVLYAIESAQPAIAATKLDGLSRFYSVGDRDATEYFRVHAVRDVEHARDIRSQLAGLLSHTAPEGVLHGADAALAANWDLLTGVDRAVRG